LYFEYWPTQYQISHLVAMVITCMCNKIS